MDPRTVGSIRKERDTAMDWHTWVLVICAVISATAGILVLILSYIQHRKG